MAGDVMVMPPVELYVAVFPTGIVALRENVRPPAVPNTMPPFAVVVPVPPRSPPSNENGPDGLIASDPVIVPPVIVRFVGTTVSPLLNVSVPPEIDSVLPMLVSVEAGTNVKFVANVMFVVPVRL